jgi:molybdenum cofactor cytidylyltransferase
LKQGTRVPFLSLVILAAGFSRRFGKNKLLETIGATSMIEHVVSEAMNSEANQVIIVCGHEHDKITQTIKRFQCELVFNEYFPRGQSYSVKKGVLAVDEKAEGVMIMPGDMPLMNHAVVDKVINEYSRTRAIIVAASHNGRPGHPILFAKSLFKEVLEIDEQSRGLKKVVSKYHEHMRLVEAGPASLYDVDTREDMGRVLSYLANPSEPIRS